MTAQQPKLAFVTGASRGIGKALVESLLKDGFTVVGLSRSATIEHPNYSHLTLDLSDLDAIKNVAFNSIADHVLLVNNAGLLGEVGPIGEIADQSIDEVMRVNTIAPQLLMNRFIQQYQNKVKSAHILNISSGAGKNPIDGWAAYCASKAALDLYSETIQLEFNLHHRQHWHIHSIAPGVVDTAMQGEIREADPTKFKSLDRFIALKTENQLTSAASVAEKLMHVIKHPSDFKTVVISVRDF